MKRSDELRAKGLDITKAVEEEIGKTPTLELILGLAIGAFAMITDIAANIADIAEKLEVK